MKTNNRGAVPVLVWVAVVLCTGCNWLPSRGSIKIPGGPAVLGVKDAGTPATLNTLNAGENIRLLAGSKVVITRFKAVAAQPASEGRPAVAAQPEREVTEIFPAGDSQWQRTEARVQADTGTVDTSIATKRIEAAESRPLLYAAILAALGAGFFVWASYPTPAIACGIASVVFFMAWRLSDLPDWFYVVGAVAAAIAVALYLGHERAEKAAKSLNGPQPKKDQ